jgi:hypothetical protein
MNKIPQHYDLYTTAEHESGGYFRTFKSEMRSKLPFLDYAVWFLLDHAEEAQKHGFSQQGLLERQQDDNGVILIRIAFGGTYFSCAKPTKYLKVLR